MLICAVVWLATGQLGFLIILTVPLGSFGSKYGIIPVMRYRIQLPPPNFKPQWLAQGLICLKSPVSFYFPNLQLIIQENGNIPKTP